MSLQRIINVCETLNIDRRKVVGVQYTRSEVAKVSETPTRNPWKFNLTISAALQYGANRDLLEQIDYLDRRYAEVVSFGTATGASAGLAYMFAYQGVMVKSQLDALNVVSFTGNQLTLNNLPTLAAIPGQANGIMFKKGDFVQIGGYPYPFTIVGPAAVNGIVTPSDVYLRDAVISNGQPQNLTLTVHRPNFIGTSVQGRGLNVGNACQFKMFCPNMPTYKLSPGGVNAIIQWTSDFQLYEWTGDIL